ncbi:MAG: hypothetical protein HY321_08670 [Armatimonadetes bacterium]|nr:hypothetical protein [Armatimonadota bacterium]
MPRRGARRWTTATSSFRGCWRRVRLAHVVCPHGRPCELGERLLARAAQVWVVLPGGMDRAEARQWMEGVVSYAGAARVTVVDDGPAMVGASEAAGARGARVALDLSALRNRYVAGGVPPGEAAEWVRAWTGDGRVALSPRGEAGSGVSAPVRRRFGRQRA